MSGLHARRYGPTIPARTLRVLAADGCVLNVHVLREAKSDSVLPMVFIHALAMEGNMWQGVADALDNLSPQLHSAMYAIDCRGHGASDASDKSFTTTEFATDLSRVLNAVNASRAHLIGCSMGGTVALAFAGRFPLRVASLTVIDATAWYGPDAPANWENRASAALNVGMTSLVEFQLARWFSPNFLAEQPELVRQSVDIFVANRVSEYAKSCRMLGHADERAALAAYTGPAAIVVGEEDYATPLTMAQDIAARLSGATLTVIPGTRHYTPLEAPRLVAACIADVINRAEALTT